MPKPDQWVERRKRERAKRVIAAWHAESNAPHELGCCCWDCVLELQGAITWHHARMKVAREAKRRPMVPSDD